MHVPDRLDLTLRLVRGSGRLTLAELAGRLGVSEMTVRRDLDQLQAQGLVRRVRGGAVALDVPSDEAGFAVREQWQADAEELWASRAAELAATHARELMDAETRWHVREQERGAVTDALWSARLAASEIQWRSEESERFAHAMAHRSSKLRVERWRRAACWVAIAVAIGSMLVA